MDPQPSLDKPRDAVFEVEGDHYIVLDALLMRPYVDVVGQSALGTYTGLLILHKTGDYRRFNAYSRQWEFRPTFRELARYFDCSLMTIQKHLKLLEEVGLVDVIKDIHSKAEGRLPGTNTYQLKEPGRNRVLKNSIRVPENSTGSPFPNLETGTRVPNSSTDTVPEDGTLVPDTRAGLPPDTAGDKPPLHQNLERMLLLFKVKEPTTKTLADLTSRFQTLDSRFGVEAVKRFFMKALALFPDPDKAQAYLIQKLEVVLETKKARNPQALLMKALIEDYKPQLPSPQTRRKVADPPPARVPRPDVTQAKFREEQRIRVEGLSLDDLVAEIKRLGRLIQDPQELIRHARAMCGTNPRFDEALARATGTEEALVPVKRQGEAR